MDFDYSNHQVFAGAVDADGVRATIIDRLRDLFPERSTGERDAIRSIVVGPPGRWVFVGDTAGSTERADPVAFDEMSMLLSRVAPTLSVKMSDSAIVHLLLYREGRLVDRFGNGTFPFSRFRSEEEAAPFRGIITEWSPYLVPGHRPEDLRREWSQEGDATEIMEETARLLGVKSCLMKVGYSIFDEADEIKYSGWLADKPVDLASFEELHVSSTARTS